VQAPAPDLPIERGRPGPGLMAHVLVSKYLDGLPLHRLSGILAREGVEIERQTLADWVGRGAWWLRPVAEAIGAYAMGQGVIWTDDTPIAVLAPGRGKTRQARFWVYAFDPRPWGGTGPPAAFYRYSPDRKGERPRGHLAGFAGWLHADAYAGYDALTAATGGRPQRITHVACMAHARRRLFEVYEATKSPIAEEGLRRIGELYAIEAAINGQSPEQRRKARAAQSKPLLDALQAWMLAQRRRLSGKSTLGKALQYALSRWEALGGAGAPPRGRQAVDRQQFGGAPAERDRRHAQEFSVRGQRCRWAARRHHLHHRGDREAERLGSRGLHRRHPRPPRARTSGQPPR
jgi:transposase